MCHSDRITWLDSIHLHFSLALKSDQIDLLPFFLELVISYITISLCAFAAFEGQTHLSVIFFNRYCVTYYIITCPGSALACY